VKRKKRKNEKNEMLTANHGSQPVSCHLESWMQNEKYESLKTFLQMGG